MSSRAEPAAPAAIESEFAKFGLFGMGVLQRIALSAVLSALLAAAAWWALA